MSRKTLVQKLKLENAQLSQKVSTFNNSMNDLIQGALLQSNLTSFNPIMENNIYAPLTINWTILTYMYKTHGIIQTAIDMPVLDAIRGGLEIQSNELSQDDIKGMDDALEEDGILDVVGEAMVWARLYGGAAIIVNTDQDPESPLQLKELKRLEFYAANRWELGAPNRVSEFYQYYGKRIHHSRVLTICGKTAPYIIRWQLAGWGMSEIEKMVEDFNRYIKTSNVIYELLEEAKIDVYRLENLNTQLLSAAGTNLTKRRMQMANQLKSFNNALVLDKNDEFEQKQITFGGLAEIMKENRIGIASALRIPMTKLFGLSASGFNSGEDDIENYNAMVESEVRQPLRTVLRKVIRLVCLKRFGMEVDFKAIFKSLRVMSSVDEEAVKTSKHNRYVSIYDRSLISSKEFGEIEQKEDLIPMEIDATRGLLDDHPVGPGQEGGEGGKPNHPDD